MLQELDQIAARIGQVIGISQQLLVERNQLKERLEAVESSEVSLRQLLSEQETKVAQLNTDLLTKTEGMRTENVSLQSQVQKLTSQVQSLEEALHKAQAELETWRINVQSVRHRVSHLFENLPSHTNASGE